MMFVIRLANGNLMAPESVVDQVSQVMGDAYVEISPADPEYPRLARQAVSEEELEARRRGWRDGDEELRREFERYLVSQGLAGPQTQDSADGPGGESPT